MYEYQGSSWYQREDSKIQDLRRTLDKKQAATYQLDLLHRIARRLDEFSPVCGECESYKKRLKELLEEAPTLAQVPSKENNKRYRQSVNEIAAHLKKVHKLVDPGMYMGTGITIGSGLGAALGSALQNAAFTGIGVGLGVAIGASLDYWAKKEGKVL